MKTTRTTRSARARTRTTRSAGPAARARTPTTRSARGRGGASTRPRPFGEQRRFDQPQSAFDQPQSAFDQPQSAFDQPQSAFDEPPSAFARPRPRRRVRGRLGRLGRFRSVRRRDAVTKPPRRWASRPRRRRRRARRRVTRTHNRVYYGYHICSLKISYLCDTTVYESTSSTFEKVIRCASPRRYKRCPPPDSRPHSISTRSHSSLPSSFLLSSHVGQ